MQKTVFASSQRTQTTNSSDVDTEGAIGAIFYLDITADAGGTLDVKIQAKDIVSGKYFDIPNAAFAQKSATGQDTLAVYPGAAAVGNEVANHPMPDVIRAVATMATSPDMTFSLGVDLIGTTRRRTVD